MALVSKNIIRIMFAFVFTGTFLFIALFMCSRLAFTISAIMFRNNFISPLRYSSRATRYWTFTYVPSTPKAVFYEMRRIWDVLRLKTILRYYLSQKFQVCYRDILYCYILFLQFLLRCTFLHFVPQQSSFYFLLRFHRHKFQNTC